MPRPSNLINDTGVLEAALEGLNLQKQRIETQIAEIKVMLGRRKMNGAVAPESEAPSRRKRQLSDAARRRIAAAQKKRWAEYRKTSGQAKAKQE